MKNRVGIDYLAIAVPQRYVALEDLAQARGIEPAKYTVGLGALHMGVPDAGEDTVALAATATARLLRASGVDPRTIGMLVVGTETGIDHSKTVASHVRSLVGLPAAMRTFDTQHACYGGTAALMAAVEWIASGAAGGRSAIVVCSDIARYELRAPGEPTQGAAAVAMLVTAEPRLLAIDVGVSGAASADVYDFWRPHGRREALVDGHYSVGCYLEALAAAFAGWRERALAHDLISAGAGHASEQLARIIYHVPFCKMAKKAHAHLRASDRGAPSSDERAEAAAFERQVAGSLGLCARTGNAYTASLYLSLAGLVAAPTDELAGKRIGLFSYGSGSCGEFFSGVVQPGAATRVVPKLEELLATRQRIGIGEYEALYGMTTPPALAPAPGTFRLEAIREHRRVYASN